MSREWKPDDAFSGPRRTRGDGHFGHTLSAVLLVGILSWFIGSTLLGLPGMDPVIADGAGRAAIVGVFLGAIVGSLAGSLV